MNCFGAKDKKRKGISPQQTDQTHMRSQYLTTAHRLVPNFYSPRRQNPSVNGDQIGRIRPLDSRAEGAPTSKQAKNDNIMRKLDSQGLAKQRQKNLYIQLSGKEDFKMVQRQRQLKIRRQQIIGQPHSGPTNNIQVLSAIPHKHIKQTYEESRNKQTIQVSPRKKQEEMLAEQEYYGQTRPQHKPTQGAKWSQTSGHKDIAFMREKQAEQQNRFEEKMRVQDKQSRRTQQEEKVYQPKQQLQERERQNQYQRIQKQEAAKQRTYASPVNNTKSVNIQQLPNKKANYNERDQMILFFQENPLPIFHPGHFKQIHLKFINDNYPYTQPQIGRFGKYYCGGVLGAPNCDCCNGFCGPHDGENCIKCMRLDQLRRGLKSQELVNTDGSTCWVNQNNRLEGIFTCGSMINENGDHCGSATIVCYACQKLNRNISRYRALFSLS